MPTFAHNTIIIVAEHLTRAVHSTGCVCVCVCVDAHSHIAKIPQDDLPTMSKNRQRVT